MTMPADLNFDYLDTLACLHLPQGRLFHTPRRRNPTLLFIHGGFHGAWCWSPYLEFFQKADLGAAAVDLRGHGGLPQGKDFFCQGVSVMADDVIDAAAALQNNVVLVGHSLGALVAMTAAERIASRGLVLLAPSAPGNVPVRRLLPPFAEDHAVAPPNAARSRKWFFQNYDGEVSPCVSRLCAESPALLNDAFQARVPIDPKRISAPALCLSGEHDDSPLHPSGQDEAVARLFGAEFCVVPKGSHDFMLTEAHGSATVILDWLRRRDLA